MKTALGLSMLWALLIFGCKENCIGVDCSGHGDCHVRDGEAVCDCDSGYSHPDEDLKTVCESLDLKPLIYLYPEHSTTVTVRFADPDAVDLVTTYPSYPETGWQVIADPDGTLHSMDGARDYAGLYWEGFTGSEFDLSQGFVVEGEQTASFLEQALFELGLTDEEASEFIMFWLPLLQENPYNLMHFATDEWDRAVPLAIEPEPDVMLRVFMVVRPLEEEVSIAPQVLSHPPRRGFVVVEWGGRIEG